MAFINNEEATLPNGKKGAGLCAYLRKLTSSDTASAASTARDTVATVFKGVDRRDALSRCFAPRAVAVQGFNARILRDISPQPLSGTECWFELNRSFQMRCLRFRPFATRSKSRFHDDTPV